MKSLTGVHQILKDPEVRKYFLGILDSSASKEDKYEKFVAFFAQVEQLERRLVVQTSRPGENIDATIAQAAQEIGIWNPAKILQQTKNSLQRALQRIQNSQHRDGGWGYQVETSNIWGTAYALMALDSAIPILGIPFSAKDNIGKGIDWIRNRAPDWSATDLVPDGQKSVYDAALAVRCMFCLKQADFKAVSASLDALLECQNPDGGWDARLWGKNVKLVRVWSEVGATSMVLQALASDRNQRHRPHLEKAIAWILSVQNNDGSWNDGSCAPDSTALRGNPSIHKTCDALRAITAAKELGISDSYVPSVDKAVKWLLQKEKPLSKGTGGAIGWGYDEMGDVLFRPDLEGTCLILEALVQVEGVSFPLITANAQWLMDAQHEEPNSVEDGKWESGDTFRTTLALLRYYTKIKMDPSFAPIQNELPRPRQVRGATKGNADRQRS